MSPGDVLPEVLSDPAGDEEVGEKSKSFHRIIKCEARTALGVVDAGVKIGQDSDNTVVVLTPTRYGQGNPESRA